MKWFIYSDDGTNAKLLLDHNTTARLAFSDSTIKANIMKEEISARLVYDTSNWDKSSSTGNDIIKIKEVSVIKANDVADITGLTSWTSTSNGSSFKGLNSPSIYAWLYNYTKNCESNSCQRQDNTSYVGYKISENNFIEINPGGMYGYWTNTERGLDTSSYVWVVGNSGYLSDGTTASNSSLGIRPVITISSSLISD